MPEKRVVSLAVRPSTLDQLWVRRIDHSDSGDVHAFLQDLTVSAPKRMYGTHQRPPDLAVLPAAGPGAGVFLARSDAADGPVIGLAAWWRNNGEETAAAAALVLAPTAQRPIAALRLLSAVVRDATQAGVRRFVVGMEPGTAELRSVARRLGLAETRRLDGAGVMVELALTGDGAA